jgi:hypothetical protein
MSPLFVFTAVNSAYPSPESSPFVENAPPSQPSDVPVFVRRFVPVTEDFTTCVHTTGSAVDVIGTAAKMAAVRTKLSRRSTCRGMKKFMIRLSERFR